MRRASPSHPTVAAHSSKVSGPHSEKQRRRAGQMAPNLSARFSSDECCDEDDEGLNRRSENVAVDAANATCMREDRLKCVLLGDGAVGKTSLVVSYSTNGYPVEYVPTAFDNYSVRVDINGTPTRLQICDTAGQDEFDGMRPLCYSGTDVFLVCFSVVRPISLCNIRDKWMAEVKKYQPKVPILLVGTQTDLRDNLDVLVDLARCNQRPVTAEVGERCAKELGAVAYVECSALTQKNLKEVFDQAIIEASSWRRRREKKKTKRKWRKRDRDSVRCGRAKSMRRKSVAWWRKLFACASL